MTGIRVGIKAGRVIGIPLIFPNLDDRGKAIKGETTIFLSLIYHPIDLEEYTDFLGSLDSFFDFIPHGLNLVNGHDANANVGTRCNNKNVEKDLGPYDIKCRNVK